MKKSPPNHIFRTIWSEVLNAWVAVSELASAKGKRSGSSDLKKTLAANAAHAIPIPDRNAANFYPKPFGLSLSKASIGKVTVVRQALMKQLSID